MLQKSKLMTAQEVADYLGISVKTLYGYRYRGIAPKGYRVAQGPIRYRTEDVEAWLEQQADRPREVS